MAKKKTTAEKSDITDDELEDDLFEEEPDLIDDSSSEMQIEEDEIVLEEEFIEEEEKDYKHVKARLLDVNNNIYRVEFKGVSHGFLNYLSSKILHVSGVNYSAYKETSLNPPILTVVTDGSVTLKKIFKETNKIMKDEWTSLKKNVEASVK
jgi:DNA-directed RNA polymerase subunit L